QFAFAGFAFLQRVDSQFTEEQRFGLGHHLQSSQVPFEGLGLVQVYVETNKINALGMQKFSRGKVGEGTQTLRVHAFGFLNELVDEICDALSATPADDVRPN